MAATQERMNIFNLSAELRNVIYELALDNHSDDGAGRIMVQVLDEDYDLDVDDALPGKFATIPALLQTSRLIRDETQQLYFDRTSFVAEVDGGDVRVMKD